MLAFAQEFSVAVHRIRDFDAVAVKIASADLSLEAQETKAKAACALYGVMEKKAAEIFPTLPVVDGMVALIEKSAHCLGKPSLTNEDRWKLAAAIATDTALSAVIEGSTDNIEREKLAEQRAYGREFLVELIGKAL